MAQAQEAELLYKIRVDAAKAIKDMEAASGTLKSFQTEAANTSSKAGNLGRNVQNMGYQFQDFIVQTSNGTDAVRALGQQLPQMLMGLGAVGSVIGVVAALLPAIITGIKSMGDASVKAAADLKRWTDEVEALGKMGKDIESFAKAITGTAADGFKAYVEEYNKASKAQRAEMEAWLKLKLEVEQAKLNDLAKEAQGVNVDWGASSGMPSGETQWQGPDKQRMVELGSQLRIQQDNVKRLSAAVNGDFQTAMAGATVKAGDFEKALSALNAKNKELISNQQLLKQAQGDYLQVFKALTESEKAKLKLDEDIKNNVVKYTSAQKEKLYGLLDENIALEKNNLLQTEAIKVINESRNAMDTYNANVAKATYLLEQGMLTQEQYNTAIDRYSKSLAAADPLISGFGSAINTAFMDATFSGKGFNDVLSNMVTSLAKVAYQVLVLEPMIRALQKSMQAAGFTSINATGGGSSGVDNITTEQWTSGNFATGGVFDGPVGSGSNVIPFARGGVLQSAKYFPMSNGTGLAGEAGPEAIIPLKRDSQGNLGVSGGGGGSSTQVNIYNESGGQVETQKRKDSNGMEVIDIYIKKAVAEGIAQGQFDKSMAATYGLRRMGAR